jgi:hypothetical protein
MKVNYKFLFFVLFISNTVLVGLLLPTVLDDKTVLLPTERDELVGRNLNFHQDLHGIAKDSIKVYFPYTRYLNSYNYLNVKSIISDLNQLDSLVGDKMMVREMISAVLTDSLNQRNKWLMKTNLDSLNYRLQWAEKFKNYAETDPSYENQLLFQSIYDYWLSKIAGNLSEYSSNNDNAKFNFQFRYLTAKCNEKRYNVPVKVSALDKVIQNLLGNKWIHLFEASWNQASIVQKVILGILILFTLFTYFFTIRYLYLIKKTN